MKILLLGPGSEIIEKYLTEDGHVLTVTDERVGLEYILSRGFDFAISFRYRHIISKDIIDHFHGSLINLHISFLPWNRGADPNIWSFLTNTPSGVSIHVIDEGVDTGPLLVQKRVEHDIEGDTLRTSYDRLIRSIEMLFLKNRDAILNKQIKPVRQTEGGSAHRKADLESYRHLWEKLGWDTPVKEVINRGNAKR